MSSLAINAYFNYTQANFITRMDYDANFNLAYIGWAIPGTPTSLDSWRIRKLSYTLLNNSYFLSNDGFPQDMNGNSSCAFAFIWDNRASYTYS